MKPLTIKFGKILFRPGWVSSLCTLLIFPLLVTLGFWQLNRYEGKLKSKVQLETRGHLPIVTLQDLKSRLPNALDTLRYRRCQVSGVYLNDRQILLDNQLHDGKVGYQVITPFQSTGSNTLLLVDRGWIPLGSNRDTLPYLPPIVGEVLLTGTLQQPVNGFSLPQWPRSAVAPLPHTPHRVQQLDFTALSAALSQTFYPVILRLNAGDPHGFSQKPLSVKTSAERHLGYAIQWFIMALVSFIYYVVINSHLDIPCNKTRISNTDTLG